MSCNLVFVIEIGFTAFQEAVYLTGMCSYQSLTNTIQFGSRERRPKNNLIVRTAWLMRRRCQKRPYSLLRIVL